MTAPIYLNKYEWQEVLSEFNIFIKEHPDVKRIEYKLWRELVRLNNNVAILIPDNTTSILIYTPYDTIGGFKTDDHGFGSFLNNKYNNTKEEAIVGPETMKVNSAVLYDNKTNEPVINFKDGCSLTFDTTYATTNLDWNNYGTTTGGTISTNFDCINQEDYNKPEPPKKERDNREMDTKKMFGNFEFGFVTEDTIRFSPYGLAVKNQAGTYVAYDESTGEIMDVEILNFKCDKMFFKMPIAVDKIGVGDILIHNRKPVIVTGFSEETLNPVVIDVYNGTRVEILPTKNCFGFNFVVKVVSIMDSMNMQKPTKDNPFGNMWMFALMGDNKMDDMLPFMVMSGSESTNVFGNPMMMYLLMSKDGRMSDMLPFMLMMNQK